MDVVDAIRTRRSIPQFTLDPIPREAVEELLEAAVWTPNHRLTEPWRFFVLEGESRRRFAEVRRQARRSALPHPDAPEAQAALQKVVDDTLRTPVIIVVASAGHADPELQEENHWATFGAAYAVMLAAWSRGIGSYFRTGKAVMDAPELRELLSLPEDHRVIGVLYLGYPALVPEKRRTPAREKTVWMS